MPASRDKNQKIAFVYSNLYRIYREGKAKDHSVVKSDLDSNSSSQAGLTRVIKVKKEGSVSSSGQKSNQETVETFEPVAFIQKKAKSSDQSSTIKEMKSDPQTIPTQNEALDGLKKNLNDLTEIQSKLRFMLRELEELVDDEE